MIRRAEDRELFRDASSVRPAACRARAIVTLARRARRASRCPRSCGPAFTLGGHGGGFADDARGAAAQVERGLRESPIAQVLVEESVRGWDEFELEVMRDRDDNVVIVCSIENLDPMGVHTGDSVTVAPQMTLSDEAYQELRDAAAAVIRAVGVETGGSNIQFARDRETGELRVIEMNPRVSRSSALASKATGYPIAKVAAKLAVGYTLDEIPNDLTQDDARELRADARLRRRQVPALRVREVPRRRPHARHADEVGRRGDGHRPHVRRGVPEGVGSRELDEARRRGELDDLAVRSHPGSRQLPPRTAARLRELAGSGASSTALRDARARLAAPGRAPSFRRVDSCAGEVEARVELLLLDLGRGRRGARAGREAARRHPRLGPEPDRPGDRVRLLLRPRRADASASSATRR